MECFLARKGDFLISVVGWGVYLIFYFSDVFVGNQINFHPVLLTAIAGEKSWLVVR